MTQITADLKHFLLDSRASIPRSREAETVLCKVLGTPSQAEVMETTNATFAQANRDFSLLKVLTGISRQQPSFGNHTEWSQFADPSEKARARG
jgi:hypothetical protein